MIKSKEKRLIFIINHYSNESNQHLFHVINLVKRIAEKGVRIVLLIERCEGTIPNVHQNVIVCRQRKTKRLARAVELFFLINRYVLKGYDKIFIRISIPAAIIASFCTRIFGGETFYWNSGGLNERPSAPHTSKDSLRTIRRINLVGKKVDHFVTGPESMLEFYPRYFGVLKEKMVLLYNDVDLRRFIPVTKEKRETIRAELGLEKDKTYILFVHRFSPIRRSLFYIPYCLRFFSNDKNLEFLLIGSGPEEADVREAVKLENLNNVFFLGSQPNNVIQKYYQSCDIFFNPSYCEGFPRVIIEAMACGMPIVTTDAGGTKDLFGDQQKYFITDIDDRDKLADRLKIMIESKELREHCTEENLVRIKMYSTETVSDMYIKTIWNDEN